MKLVDILKTASGNMLQSKLRTALTIIAIFIGALTLTLTTGIGAGISQYVDEQVDSIGAKDVIFISAKQEQSMSISSSDEPAKYDPDKATDSMFGFQMPVLTRADLDKIEDIEGISEVAPMQYASARYAAGKSGEKYQGMVDGFVSGTNVTMDFGSMPDNGAAENQVVVPHNYAKAFGYENAADIVGQEIVIGVQSAEGDMLEIPVKVVGVPQKSIISSGVLSINQAAMSAIVAQQNKGLPEASLDRFQSATARFSANASDEDIKAIKDRLDEAGYAGQTVQDQLGIIKQVISAITMVFAAFGAIALVAASFGVINTLLMAVQERTKEIGLMKAMGMSGGRIFTLFSAEAILLGFWGSLLGVLVAYGLGSIANGIATESFLKDFEGLELLIFPIESVLSIMGIIMLITFLAGTLPARRAAKLNAIDALKYE